MTTSTTQISSGPPGPFVMVCAQQRSTCFVYMYTCNERRVACAAWAKKRGYVTAKAARLDTHRAANSLLRLAVDGRIVLSIKPPGFYEHLDAEQKAAEEVRAHVAIPEVEDSADDAAGVESGDSDSHEATALRETLNPFALLDDNDC